MKKKIIGIALASSLMLTGVVSAANMWGSYKGNDIIRVTSNGSVLSSPDVPAISYNSRTMIPISMLYQIGVGYTWDQNNKTVNVFLQNPSTTGPILESKNNILKANMYKYMEDFGETLGFVKSGFDLDMLSKVSGIIPNSKTIQNLSNAINDYNNFIAREDVKLFSQTDSNVNTALKYYYDGIDELKKVELFVSGMQLKADSSAVSNYQFYANAAINKIYQGDNLARQGFQNAISASLK